MHEVTILLENGRNNDLIETCRKYREQQLNKWNSSEESHFDQPRLNPIQIGRY